MAKRSFSKRVGESIERNAANARRLELRAAIALYRKVGVCRNGHPLSKGPLGLKLCNSCTLDTLDKIRASRRNGVVEIEPNG